ncbi:hypothetical protein BGZ65_009276 [Modicella reniformis]|uniref:Chromo domain-containing protein n=1 Tax=Modicella reniformis TaxID=1440133 RepID=A0A9P6JLB9_9FUNG|nr:hypothetical protein BGZ65_009276 [Modicella reniformis]
MKLVLEEPTDDEAIFEVEKILDHRPDPLNLGKHEYQTKWKGYEKPTWEPERNFVERRCIRDYWRENNTQVPKRKRRRA